MTNKSLDRWLSPLLSSVDLNVLLDGGTPSKRLIGAIHDVSTGLTGPRDMVGHPYLDSDAYRAAYAAFWWPVTYIHARTVLNHTWVAGQGSLEVLDLGAGSGACSAALLDLAQASGATCTIHALDHSSEALKELQTLIEPRLGPSDQLHAHNVDIEFLDDSTTFDLIVLGHVFNELFTGDPNRGDLLTEFLKTLLARLKPGGRLVVIEPALKSTSQDLLRARDALALTTSARIIAPCTRIGPCPALEDDDWCHTSVSWTPPQYLQRLSQESGLDRTRLRFSYLVLSNEEAAPHPGSRVVSEPLHTKGRLRYMVCNPSGRYALVAPESRVKGETEPFRKLVPGTLIEHGPGIQKGDGLDISKSFVRVIARQEDPL